MTDLFVSANPWFWLLASLAILNAAISKGGFGGGSVALGVPLITLSVSPVIAAAIMLPLLCLMDLFAVRAYWMRWSWPLIRLMLAGGLTGIAIGTASFFLLNITMLKLILGLLSLIVVTQWLLPKVLQRAERPPVKGNPVAGFFWSVLMGFTSHVAHAGGPAMMIWLLPQRLDKTLFVATASFLYLVMNYVKLIPYSLTGQFTTQALTTALVLSPLVPLGIWAGAWLHRRMSQDLFYAISYSLLGLTGVKLLWDVVVAGIA